MTEEQKAATDAQDIALERFRKKPRVVRIVRARMRLIISIAVGVIALWFWSQAWPVTMRLLASFDIAVALYIAFALVAFSTPEHRSHIRRNALMQDDGRFVILILVGVAAFASLAAILALIGAEGRTDGELWLAAITVLLSWTMIHTTFALHYAHDYYRGTKPGGLDFPGDEPPDYWDFVYLSFVIGTTAQTSDVGITSRLIRRTVTAHGLVSFLFNTALLALMVNIAASAVFGSK